MKSPTQVSGGAGARRFRLKALGPAEYSPPRLPNENPQAGERLGVSALKSRPPWRISDVGAEGSYAIATLMLAARHYLLLLPFGPVPLHFGMRPVSLCRPGRMLAPLDRLDLTGVV